MTEDYNSGDEELLEEDRDKRLITNDELSELWNEEYPTDYREETAVEQAPVKPFVVENETRETFDDEERTTSYTVGIFAVVLSVLSLFFMPILLGIGGIVVGFIARRVGTEAIGNWAIGIGAISILMKLFFSPLF